MPRTLDAKTTGPQGPIDRRVKRVAVVIVLSSIMSVLDTTIVNVALDSLSKDLDAPLNDIQWVVTAYLLALAAIIPVSGWAIRRFGAYRVFLWALVLFTLGSALCGLASSVGELIAFRVVQGLGGGLLVPTGMTILVKAAGPQNLPRIMGMIGVPIVLAPVFGPTLGGLLLQSVGWQAIFMVNVPIGIVTVCVATRLLPRDRPDPTHAGRLDWVGLLLAGAGTVGVIYGLSASATVGSFTAPSVVMPLLIGIMLLVAFVLRARRISYALLDLKLYQNRQYSAATVVMFCLGGALFAAMLLLPLYYQVARGQDAIHTGLLLVPQGIGAAFGMNRSGHATRRFGAGLTSLCGGTIVVIGTLPFLFIGATTSYAAISAAMVVRGIGTGLAIMPAMTAAFSVLRHDEVADASPQLNVIQRVGGSVGTAVIAVVLQSKLTHLPSHPTAAATAGAFAQTYRYVVAMALLALIPAAVLWRLERRARMAGDEHEVSDLAIVEAVA